MKAVYSAGLAAKAGEAGLAREFIARYAAPNARALLEEAGYELE